MSSKKETVIQRIFLVVTLAVFFSSFIIAYLNTAGVEGLFFSSNGYVDDKYYQELSPDGVAFSIVWPVIYTWNAAAILYIAVSVFLPERKSPMNIKPTLVPTSFLVFHSLGFGSTLAWLFAFDAEILSLSLSVLALSALSLYVAVGVSYKRVHDNLATLEKKENRVMLWLVRILIQNGLCLPATWLTIATCLNTTDVIIYEDSFGIIPPIMRGTISVEDASTIMLSVLFAIIISWSLLDNFVLEKYTRHTFTVYPVLVLGLSGLVAKLRYKDANRNLIYASVVLGFSVFALLFRVFYFIYRRKQRQIGTVDDQEAVIENKHTEFKF